MRLHARKIRPPCSQSCAERSPLLCACVCSKPGAGGENGRDRVAVGGVWGTGLESQGQRPKANSQRLSIEAWMARVGWSLGRTEIRAPGGAGLALWALDTWTSTASTSVHTPVHQLKHVRAVPHSQCQHTPAPFCSTARRAPSSVCSACATAGWEREQKSRKQRCMYTRENGEGSREASWGGDEAWIRVLDQCGRCTPTPTNNVFFYLAARIGGMNPNAKSKAQGI